MTLLPEYNQQAGEELLDWKYRLIFGKAKKEVKLSWDEISQLLGIGCSGEYLRKIAYGVLEYADYQNSKSQLTEITDAETNILDELETKRMDMQREKMRMQDQKRELNKLLREYARAEHIKSELQAAVKEMASVKPLCINSIPATGGTREAALLLSDWHKGQHSSNHWNLYNDVEFYKRIERLVSKAIAYGKDHDVRCMHVFSLGDLINGLIHVTTRINSTENSVRQVMAVAEVLAGILVSLAKEFEEVKAYFSRGNHERVSPNIKESIASESFFDVIPWYIEARIKDVPNITLVENKENDEIVVANICGQSCFAVHGHRDKISSVVQNLSLMLRKFPDCVFMAHYHHSEENEIHGAEIIVNSSLCGTDSYAAELRRTAKAAQKLIVFDDTEGRLCTYNIKVA